MFQNATTEDTIVHNELKTTKADTRIRNEAEFKSSVGISDVHHDLGLRFSKVTQILLGLLEFINALQNSTFPTR